MVERMEHGAGGYVPAGSREAPGEPLGDARPAAGLREQIEDLTAQARLETKRLALDARDEMRALARRRKNLLAERLGGIASALRDAGQRLEDEALPATAPARSIAVDAGTRGLCELAVRAAEQVDEASGYLRRREVRELVRDLEAFARRHPAAFVGGSLATGLLLARFFKSSGERAPRRTTSSLQEKEPWLQSSVQ